MENFLIIIIIIGAVIYKIYSTYKEEVEKAKKRNPQARPTVTEENYTQPNSKKEKKMSFPTVQRFPTENIKQQYNYESPNAPEVLPEEVRRARIAKKNVKPVIIPKLKIESNQKQPIEFNLRQAVIQSIILERPYK